MARFAGFTTENGDFEGQYFAFMSDAFSNCGGVFTRDIASDGIYRVVNRDTGRWTNRSDCTDGCRVLFPGVLFHAATGVDTAVGGGAAVDIGGGFDDEVGGGDQVG